MRLEIEPLKREDGRLIAEAFARQGWSKPPSQFDRYWREQQEGSRIVLVAKLGDQVLGYVTVRWESSYEPFRVDAVPEIVDLNVFLAHRKRGIGTALLERAEREAGHRSKIVGIGVAMDGDYGPAQRLYVKRGYVPDGRGLTYRGRHLRHGEKVTVDDDLVLYFRKELSEG